MKKIIGIMLLLPAIAFAEGDTHSNPNVYASNDDCNALIDKAARKECIIAKKNSEANENYQNFQKSNQTPYQDTF